MLKFFRRIRAEIFNDHGSSSPAMRIRKYLLYALGEIVLVVIGILIALSINNANQNSIIREKEQKYLAGLLDEFQASKTKLDNLIKVNRQNYTGAKKLLLSLENSATEMKEDELNILLFNSLVFDVAYNPNNSLLEEMMSSGSLKDISNPQLRTFLTSWDSFIGKIRIQEAELRQQRQDIVDLFRNGNGSIRAILDQANVTPDMLGIPKSNDVKSNMQILRSQEFENNMLLFILTSISTEKEHYQPLSQRITEIQDLLESEIKK